MSFVVRNGYSKRWRTIERVSTDAFGLGKDPRVERDAKERQEVQWKLKTAQALALDVHGTPHALHAHRMYVVHRMCMHMCACAVCSVHVHV